MRNRKQAGVSYVEALIVAPALIALFAGTLWVGRRYDGRIMDGQRARERAWTAALPGCARALSADDIEGSLRAVQQKVDTGKQVACNELVP